MIQDMINSDNMNSTESTIPNIFEFTSFQVLRLPATTGRPKIGEANRIVEATC